MPLLRRRRLDTHEFTVETKYCEECEMHYVRVTGWVHEPNGGPTLAAYYAVCHGHPEHEVALDVALGTWGADDVADHETFSCLLRPYGAMAVDPYLTLCFDDGDEIPEWLGRPMNREDALRSPRIKTVWKIVDALAASVDPITEQVRANPPWRRGPRAPVNHPG